MNELDLHHLRCIVALGEELNFGRAAARLHMSQPPLSRLVTDVERLVGARLFERTTRRVSLTPVGEVLVTEGRAVLARAEQALESVRAVVRRQAGKLRLGYTWAAFNTVLPALVTRLRERDHDVSVDLVELSTEAQQEALTNGHVDMGFTDEPLQLEGFECLQLIELPMSVLLHAGHPLAGADTVQFGSLAGETLILHARHENPRHYEGVLVACREAGFTPRVHHRDARQNCIALVATGQGVLLTPALGYPVLPAGLRSLRLVDAPPQLRAEVWAVIPVTPVSPAVAVLRDLVRASLPGSSGTPHA